LDHDGDEQALAGGLDAWAETPRGRLALVLLLDQMTRSVFRGTARAFAGDARAQRLATGTLQTGTPAALDFEHRHFFYMPLLHAEDAALLDLFNEVFPQALARVPDWARPLLSDGIEQGEKYREVFARFGRFPHRNEALGRCSTPAELEFLAPWEACRRPKIQRARRLALRPRSLRASARRRAGGVPRYSGLPTTAARLPEPRRPAGSMKDVDHVARGTELPIRERGHDPVHARLELHGHVRVP
jgi:uncharacterized protein (DUF924 family)